jgi:eukaryotic-like serine/threonine-protein kinase
MRRTKMLIVAAISLIAVLGLTGCGSKVPDVVGMGQAEAVRTLQAAGYTLGDVTFVATSTVPIGMIAMQNPAAGDSARKDTPVALGVNFNEGTRAKVPIVVGLTQVTAENVATTLRFVPLIVEQYSTTVEKGLVASQSPEPMAEVTPGSTLVIVVSKGAAPAKKAVPNVVGKTQAAAQKALADAGFPNEVLSVYNAKVAKGNVIAQTPAASTSALVGSKVQLVVSLGAGTGSAKVPAVKGRSEADANKAIQAAGLKVRRVAQYSGTVARGVVSAQFPDAGTTAAAGSEVLIVVSLGAEPSNAVAVPNVVGQLLDAATTALRNLGFSVSVETVPSESTSGTVEFQFPQANAKAAPGSEVLVVVGAPKP